jgi:hypothetical protein
MKNCNLRERKKEIAAQVPGVLSVQQRVGEAPLEAITRTVALPTVQAAKTMTRYLPAGELSVDALVTALDNRCAELRRGEVSGVEAILCTQAETLNAIFHSLARRATAVEYLDQFDTHMRLALKAQAQCRVTLETVATLRRPSAVFAKQANIAHGPQQVNISMQKTVLARDEKPQSELLERSLETQEHQLDPRTTAAASSSNPRLEAMGAINRPSHSRREVEGE